MAQTLLREGLEVRAFERISAFGLGLTRRHAYRVALADGRTIKARRTLDEAQARRVVEALQAVDDARFARVLARHGPVLLEEWVDGVPPTSATAEDGHLAEAAAVLAKVHRVEAVGGLPVRGTGGPPRASPRPRRGWRASRRPGSSIESTARRWSRRSGATTRARPRPAWSISTSARRTW